VKRAHRLQLGLSQVDPVVAAIPFYFATMAAERAVLARLPEDRRALGAYEWPDAAVSLTMGVGSLLAPLVLPRILRPFGPGGRHGRTTMAVAAVAAAVAAGGDHFDRRHRLTTSAPGERPAPPSQVHGAAAAVAVAVGGLATATWWRRATRPGRLWRSRITRDLGGGWPALALAVLGWDFVYYWNHRFQHRSRFMWAIHVVHHSSERYNLATALRQPVAEATGTFIPTGLLCLFGIRPEVVERARALNLLYQYWIHTVTIGRLGPFERVLNTPSHHRVHHGSNPAYLDRNHGSILIVWDKVFGTFESEREPPVYGLIHPVGTSNPVRVAFGEHAVMLRDVRRSRTWRERFEVLLRPPGWVSVEVSEGAAPSPAR